MTVKASMPGRPHLSKREIETLACLLMGNNAKETAKILGGLSNRTVHTYRSSIRKKFREKSYKDVINLIKNFVEK